MSKAYKTTKKTLTNNRPMLDELTTMLLENETVDFKEVHGLVGKYNPALAKANEARMPTELK